MSDGVSQPHEKRPIKWWFGDRQDRSGWVTESVAILRQDESVIYVHHGYRPLLDGDKTARKEFFFRGARVCRA
jgi:hypothetical protein